MSGRASNLSNDNWITYSQHLHSSQRTHVPLVSKGSHIPRRDEAFVCVFLHIIGSHRDLRVRPGCVEDSHVESPQDKIYTAGQINLEGFKKMTPAI